ncbi:glycerol kinase GlpK [Patescibacteria group bacterium]
MPGKEKYIVAIDAGTTSIRVFCYDQNLKIVQKVQQEFKQHYPKPGWVEHDAAEIWQVTKRLLDQVLEGRSQDVAAIGITNQRETTVMWNKKTGKPAHRAIVWQCRRTADECERLKQKGIEKLIQSKTGLVCDAYFSGTKIKWILDHIKGPKKDLLFGTIDSWLIWNLTSGGVHATDFTNASRTMLYNIRKHDWDSELAKELNVPAHILPAVQNSQDDFGTYNGIPIAGVAGDQQAALFGRGAVKQGAAKNTYGTGCFLLMNTGNEFIRSKNGLITTLTPDKDGRPLFALEGSVFIGGAVVQWLRDELKLIKNAEQTEKIANSVAGTQGVYVVPAFAGLGAPHWNQDARGIITGLTRGANKNHIIRAALESIAFQVYDLVRAMESDAKIKIKDLAVDGGASSNNFLMQFQADIMQLPINRPQDRETTVLGAALLAGLKVGFWSSPSVISELRKIEKVFKPNMTVAQQEQHISGWSKAIRQVQAE